MGFSRFNKRWASSGQVETITENNANLGLAFLGNEPPSAELHNQIFQWLDEKDNYLFNLLDEVKRERTGTGLSASPLTQLADAIATAATTTKAGIQPNATGAQTLAMASAAHSVTPASLKPLIDSMVLGITNSVPSGGVLAFARSSPPIGWLVANGAAVSRSQYIELFNAIGTTFGAGNGSTTFNLPNIQGAVVRGWNGSGTGVDSGRGFGSIQLPQNQAHAHTGTTMLSGVHDHTVTVNSAGSHSHSISTSSDGSHSHAITNLGDRAAWATPLPAGFSSNRVYGDESFHPNITSFTGSSGSHSHSGSAASAGAHTHTGAASSSGAHSHTFDTSTEGGENRMYNIALLYCIKI